MSFFKKLKSRLFKSSKKLESGLDAIIEEKPEPESVSLSEEEIKKTKELNPNKETLYQKKTELSGGS